MPDDKQAIHEKPPTVTINGETHQIRRLGVRDFFVVGRIASRGAAIALQEGQDFSNLSGEQMMVMFAVGLPYAEDEGMGLIASLLGVDTDDLDDTERFPMSTVAEVADVLTDHQDLRDFFGAAGRVVAKRGRKTQTRSRKRSAS